MWCSLVEGSRVCVSKAGPPARGPRPARSTSTSAAWDLRPAPGTEAGSVGDPPCTQRSAGVLCQRAGDLLLWLLPCRLYRRRCPATPSVTLWFAGFFCSDLDECRHTNGGCSTSPRVECVNTRVSYHTPFTNHLLLPLLQGSHHCGPCPPGHSGDGRTCRYLGACHLANGGCHPLATCVEQTGGELLQLLQQCPRTGALLLSPWLRRLRGRSSRLSAWPGACAAWSRGSGTPRSGGRHAWRLLSTHRLQVAPCASSPCLNGGTCRPTAASYFCHCAAGFQGARCQQRENHCVGRPCSNGGTCVSSQEGRVCECNHGFTGPDCQEEVLSCGGHFDQPAGFIDFPVGVGTFYDHSISCDYVIRVEPGMVVNLTFTEFRWDQCSTICCPGRLEGGGGTCEYDWLQILDGG